jgi:hypothetical protein
MQEVNTKVQLAIHTDASSDFNVLGINHTNIFYFRCYIIVSTELCGCKSNGNQ